MGLFDKKNCDICGGKIGLLGNRKLEDGNMCKDCAKLLSPWFSERRRSTLADINAQLAYREENKTAVSAFRVTRSLGLGTKVMLDEDAGKFIVSGARRWQDENPDVLDFSQVTGCHIDVKENRSEEKRKETDGRMISYNPPRYTYSYDFDVVIHVHSPWFDEIRFRLNNSSIEVKPVHAPSGSLAIGGLRLQTGGGGSHDPRQNVAYRECETLGEEIRQALTQVRQGVRDSIAAANVPKIAKQCPCCGATSIPDANGRCEYCGGAM
ncbi:MAG: DUF4428 domain-containing protein [Clostridiales bacterium]|nr:DUF4428 domain-containing protein [Clostridiales bacterium]